MGKFDTGISYDEPINRLNRILTPKAGDKISKEKLEAIIQTEPPRFYAIIRKWMKQIKGAGLKPVWRRKEGIYFQFESEALGSTHHKLELTGKRIGRIDRDANEIDGRQLSEHEQAQHNLIKRFTSEKKKEFRAAAKELKPPAPVTGSNLRVVKTN